MPFIPVKILFSLASDITVEVYNFLPPPHPNALNFKHGHFIFGILILLRHQWSKQIHSCIHLAGKLVIYFT